MPGVRADANGQMPRNQLILDIDQLGQVFDGFFALVAEIVGMAGGDFGSFNLEIEVADLVRQAVGLDQRVMNLIFNAALEGLVRFALQLAQARIEVFECRDQRLALL
jgi:hypothetical protein